MKKYEKPELKVEKIETIDVIAASFKMSNVDKALYDLKNNLWDEE